MCLHKQNCKSKIAFTLAEVLITLLIIGIVSSIVIPAIINDTQNQEFAVLLKKDFGALSNAGKRVMLDNGGTLAGLFNNPSDMMNGFGNYIVFTKKCDAGVQGCFYAGTTTWKNLHGDYGWLDHTSYAGINSTAILSNGGLIMFKRDDVNCERVYGTEPSPVRHTCGWIHLDVNGFKRPNILGKDIFAIWVTKNGIYPFGMINDGYNYCNKNESHQNSGRGCAAVILSGGMVN